MAARIYYKSSKPKRKTAPEPTTSTTVTGRRVKRRPETKPTNGSKPRTAVKSKKSAKARKATAPVKAKPRTAVKPKKSAKARKATAPAKTSKPLTASKKAKAIKPRTTANRRVIPPATKATHRATPTTKKSVTFSLDAPTGSYVAVGGTFSNWEPQAMTKGSDGIWRITLLLARGMHQYRFQVDAQWREDPNNPRNAPNDHGGYDSICEVL
jgi:hypothetical protein